MQDDFNSMVHEMLGYSPSDEIPENEFARLTAIYAYSPFIQFLYSQKLREKDPHRYAASVAKTALYFSNPHWLNHQLRDEHPSRLKTRNYRKNESVVVETGEVDIDEIIDADEHSEVNIANETFDHHPVNFAEELIEPITTQVEETKVEPVETINDLYTPDESSINEEIKSENNSVEKTESSNWNIESPVVENLLSGEGELISPTEDEKVKPFETINDLYSSEEVTINEELRSENLPVDETTATETREWDNVTSAVETAEAQHDITSEDQALSSQAYQEEFLPDDIVNEVVPIDENYDLLDISQEESEQLVYDQDDHFFDEELNSIEEQSVTTDTNDVQQTNIPAVEESGTVEVESFGKNIKETAITEQELPVEIVNDIDQVELPDGTSNQTTISDAATIQPGESKKPAAAGELAFEPLYTIDYFASQGIKLSTEDDGKDKLTTRLKSFTDWLKSMKKLHPEKLSREIDEATELNIKTGAEHSNDQSEILTETMAEVFLKQGLNEKALEVYEKLSLLNPSKSDYFAAKISALKAIGI
ncbi:hypothetical protein [Pollutibacter soli]|uniref:hypothetical protein n=1 Tax=Pollutibacter soli TaxID=3034157 RepID=UPI003013CD01